MKDKKHRLKAKADKMIQEWVRATYGGCLLCGKTPICGHHFVNKSNCLALRYRKENLIPLCMSCHCLIHAQPAIPNAQILQIMGDKWFHKILQEKKKVVRDNIKFYQNAIETLGLI